jgi:hypothetical protein
VSSEFFVDVHEDGGSARARIGIRQGDNTSFMIPLCATEEELAAAMDEMQAHLSRLHDEAVQELRARKQQEAEASGSLDPISIWSTMKNMESREDMFNYFNSLEEPLRRDAAEYILTQVSMFKGLGPLFASHYNAQSAHLE